jgi:hypothetical protein
LDGAALFPSTLRPPVPSAHWYRPLIDVELDRADTCNNGESFQPGRDTLKQAEVMLDGQRGKIKRWLFVHPSGEWMQPHCLDPEFTQQYFVEAAEQCIASTNRIILAQKMGAESEPDTPY